MGIYLGLNLFIDLSISLFFHHRSCALRKLTNRKRRCITLKELSTIHHGIGKLSTSFSLSWFENGQYLVVVRHNTIDLCACGELDINNYSRNRFELIRREPLRRLYAFPVSDKISAYILLQFLLVSFRHLGCCIFTFISQLPAMVPAQRTLNIFC